MDNQLGLIKEAARKADKNEDFDLHSDNLFNPDDLSWDKSTLIDTAATVLWNQMGTVLSGMALIDRVWLERMVAQKVANRHMEEGYLDWTLHIGLPGNKVTKSVTVTYPVRNGQLIEAQYFRIPSGSLIPLTKEGLLNYITVGRRPGW